jgi:copper chaperone CopZ
VCAHAVRVSLKSVSGVDSVDVSLAKGIAVVKMKPGNNATLKQLQGAITKNGFTMKNSAAAVAGTIVVGNGKTQLQISGTNEVLILLPESQASGDAASLGGKSVLVEGVIPEAAKGKIPDSIRYRSIKEVQLRKCNEGSAMKEVQ